jgi:hypothetical protein
MTTADVPPITPRSTRHAAPACLHHNPTITPSPPSSPKVQSRGSKRGLTPVAGRGSVIVASLALRGEGILGESGSDVIVRMARMYGDAVFVLLRYGFSCTDAFLRAHSMDWRTEGGHSRGINARQ